MKFLNWIKNHIVLTSVIIFLPIAAIVSAVTVLTSKAEYDTYAAEYDARKKEDYLKMAHLPEEVKIENGYVTYGDDVITSTKSEYKNNYLYFARDCVVAPLNDEKAEEYKKIDPAGTGKLNEYISSLDRSGGAITFQIEANEAGFSDVAVEMKSNWLNGSNEVIAYDNITDQIEIQFNKLNVKTTNLSLPGNPEGFTTLLLKKVNLLKGVNTLTLTTSAYNPYKTDANKILYVMPDIRNVAVMAEVTVTMPEAS